MMRMAVIRSFIKIWFNSVLLAKHSLPKSSHNFFWQSPSPLIITSAQLLFHPFFPFLTNTQPTYLATVYLETRMWYYFFLSLTSFSDSHFLSGFSGLQLLSIFQFFTTTTVNWSVFLDRKFDLFLLLSTFPELLTFAEQRRTVRPLAESKHKSCPLSLLSRSSKPQYILPSNFWTFLNSTFFQLLYFLSCATTKAGQMRTTANCFTQNHYHLNLFFTFLFLFLYLSFSPCIIFPFLKLWTLRIFKIDTL